MSSIIVPNYKISFSQFEKLMSHVYDLADTVDLNKERHPEKNVLEHSLQVFLIATKESSNLELILAALLHDIGKKENTLGHEKIALDMLKAYDFITYETRWLIENHLRIRMYLSGEMKKLKKRVDLIDHRCLYELIQLTSWDKMGRNPNKDTNTNINFLWERLVNCRSNN